MRLCFPNKKIAVFDSGKLHIMMELLKKLKIEGHKIIIFTQMSKMLDIFELALNIYNFTYVRLDGSTKVCLKKNNKSPNFLWEKML
jgi:SNF2 family DNA or RNA helicase